MSVEEQSYLGKGSHYENLLESMRSTCDSQKKHTKTPANPEISAKRGLFAANIQNMHFEEIRKAPLPQRTLRLRIGCATMNRSPNVRIVRG